VIERVHGPASVARHVDRHAYHPGRHDDSDVRVAGKDATVRVVMADVDVAIDANTADAEERNDTASDAQTGADRAHPLTTSVKQLRTNDRTCRTST